MMIAAIDTCSIAMPSDAHADDCEHDGKWNNHRRDQAGAQPEEHNDQGTDDDEGLRHI